MVWERHLHAHLESSPLPVDGNLYLGTDTAEVLALDAGDGHTVWNFKAPGAIKASPSYDAGNVFVADYQSSMFALEREHRQAGLADQHEQGRALRQGRLLLLARDRLRQRLRGPRRRHRLRLRRGTGKVRWSFDTGGAVYGSPAVAQVPGTPPTVYIGSENGTFYALDARTGKVELDLRRRRPGARARRP